MSNGLKQLTLNNAKGFVFSGGEVQVEVTEFPTGLENGHILARIQSSDDLFALLMHAEVVSRKMMPWCTRLIIPYFPYARQDRITSPSVAFSLKVAGRLISDLGFGEVVSCDVHSDVTAALVTRMRNVTQLELITEYNDPLSQFIKDEIDLIVSPDAGAYKKASAVAAFFKKDLVVAAKARDMQTGSITETRVLGDVESARCLIVDDICDGGRTFIDLGRALRNAGAQKVALYVTHGIFSNGYVGFANVIDRIYTTDAFIPKSLPLLDETPLFINPLPYERI